jgi:hypothetical protein
MANSVCSVIEDPSHDSRLRAESPSVCKYDAAVSFILLGRPSQKPFNFNLIDIEAPQHIHGVYSGENKDPVFGSFVSAAQYNRSCTAILCFGTCGIFQYFTRRAECIVLRPESPHPYSTQPLTDSSFKPKGFSFPTHVNEPENPCRSQKTKHMMRNPRDLHINKKPPAFVVSESCLKSLSKLIGSTFSPTLLMRRVREES